MTEREGRHDGEGEPVRTVCKRLLSMVRRIPSLCVIAHVPTLMWRVSNAVAQLRAWTEPTIASTPITPTALPRYLLPDSQQLHKLTSISHDASE